MLNEAHHVDCPTCGGPVGFRVGASRGAVCPHCRASVVRAPDGSATANGTVADLMPTNPPMHVGDRGRIEREGFVVLGRQQLDHGAGPWDEFFVLHDRGTTAWLARAQGRWFVTSESPNGDVPPIDELALGTPIPGGALRGYAPSEIGRYHVVSAEGELPLPIASGDEGRFVDLDADGDRFATIDDDGTSTRVYVGRRLDPDDVSVGSGEATAPVGEKQRATAIRCHSCGASIDLFADQETVRIGCSYCGALIDRDGGVIGDVSARRKSRLATPIPLGREGTLLGGPARVIGYLLRTCEVDGIRYSWDELLFVRKKGLVWLSLENGHGTLYTDLPPSVARRASETLAYEGETFHLFSRVTTRVARVVGEMPWQVTVGETVESREFIAPPRSISVETSGKEVSVSLGQYVDLRELFAAFGEAGNAPLATGVGTTQPLPPVASLVKLAATFAALLGLVQLVFALWAAESTIVSGPLELPLHSSSSYGDERSAVTLLDELVIGHRTVLEVNLGASMTENTWIESEISLVDLDHGTVYEVDALAEFYTGTTSEGGWSEGDTSPTYRLSSVPAGRYLVRAETAWDRWPSDPVANRDVASVGATLELSTHDAGGGMPMTLLVLLVLPVAGLFWYRSTKVVERWSESNVTEEGTV